MVGAEGLRGYQLSIYVLDIAKNQSSESKYQEGQHHRQVCGWRHQSNPGQNCGVSYSRSVDCSKQNGV
jgi:hypothetical protein